jgi:hypothetical protein
MPPLWADCYPRRVVLRQPGGDVLAILVMRGRETGVCTSPYPEVARDAIAQLEGWGFAVFSQARSRVGAWEYRVTALGRAAHAWGWAELHRAASPPP